MTTTVGVRSVVSEATLPLASFVKTYGKVVIQVNDTLHPTDWRVIEPEFRARFAGRLVKSMPNRPPGVNPMTPELLGFVRTADGDVVEVTTGMFLDHRMYGIVHPRIEVGGDRRADPRDRCVHSLDELEEALA